MTGRTVSGGAGIRQTDRGGRAPPGDGPPGTVVSGRRSRPSSTSYIGVGPRHIRVTSAGGSPPFITGRGTVPLYEHRARRVSTRKRAPPPSRMGRRAGPDH